MCYVLFLSTTSADDLSGESSDLIRLKPDENEVAVSAKLSFPNRWYVGSKSVCSCTFRHLMSSELGFGKPVDWYPEEADALRATAAFAAMVRKILAAGHDVDCIDIWSGSEAELMDLEVDLNQIADHEFRFFENYHFHFVQGREPGH